MLSEDPSPSPLTPAAVKEATRRSLLGAVRASKAVSDLSSRLGTGLGQDEGEEEVAPPLRSPSPKRAIALTALIACLGFIIITVNIIVRFVTDFAGNERIWRNLQNFADFCKNNSKIVAAVR